MEPWDYLLVVSGSFVGFSLEKRLEWRDKGGWRCRVLPNKQERQHYRIEVYASGAFEALEAAYKELVRIREENG